ncbi:hypothetical protein DVH24_022900 [Malus domestica]|uniref:Uncharacterized protein n=1 Tax=Malus domestica TaxID=3750 RepID=A0A498KMM5_MALDO|nr:hypothetical protein DVH24_022900 [Malus domestica]
MIAKYPVVMNLSLERRLIPRSSVVKVLLLKGLINENFNLGSVVIPVKKQFLETFVNRFAMIQRQSSHCRKVQLDLPPLSSLTPPTKSKPS